MSPQKESMELNMIEQEKEKENEGIKMKFSEVVVEGNNLWNFLTWHDLRPNSSPRRKLASNSSNPNARKRNLIRCKHSLQAARSYMRALEIHLILEVLYVLPKSTALLEG